MTKYILAFLIANSLSALVLSKYIYKKFINFYDTKLDKIDWLINKVISLENEVNELHEIINNLEIENENNIGSMMHVKKELDYSNQQRLSLNEKLDFLTKTTYDIIENDSSSDSKIFSTLEFDKQQHEI